MQTRTIFWKRYNHNETGFNLIEIQENGQLNKRHFASDTTPLKFYKETKKTHFQAKGLIIIEKVDFGPDHQLTKPALLKKLETVTSFALSDWQKARSEIRKLQKETEDNLDVDYHSMLILEPDSLPDEIVKTLDRFDFPIVKFRFNFNGDILQRKQYPEQTSIEFSPTLNERFYFHHIPSGKYLTMTGDDLFALHTKTYEGTLTDDGFCRYVDEMMHDVEENLKRYRNLIISQRDRRAMLETDVIGDLYPR